MAKKKYKKIWASREKYDAHEARVERDLQCLRTLAERAWAELEQKKPERKSL
jgi:hypothetical protein